MTAFNPPSFLFFNGVTFNPDIIEQGDTVVSGGIGDVTLAGNNNFTGANSFTGGSINVTTQTNGNSTTLASSTLFVQNAITLLRSTANFWSAINTFQAGIQSQYYDSQTNTGTILIGTRRNPPSITIGRTTTATSIITAPLYPLRVNYIDTILTTDTLYLGQTAQLISIGSSFSGGIYIANNLETTGGISLTTDAFGQPLITTTGGSLFLGETTIPVNIVGNLLIGDTASNYINLDTTTGVTRLLLNGSAGTSGYVLQSGGPSGNLSWVPASGGSVTLAGNNVFTGINQFTNVAGIVAPSINGIAGVGSTLDVGNTMDFITIGNLTCETTIKNKTNLEIVDIADNLTVFDIDTALVNPLYIGGANANQILLGSATNDIPVTIPGTINIYVDELVVDQDSGKKYVSVDKLYVTTGTSGEATIDTKTAIPLHIAPSTTVEPGAICTGVVIGNSTIPVTINSTTTTFTGTNSFTGGSINVTTQSAGNNTTLASSTAFVTSAITALKTAVNTWSGANDFTTGSLNVTTQSAGNNTTLASSTSFVTSAITALKTAVNTWSGANDFTTGSLNVTTQSAGNNTTLSASTAFVTTAVSNLQTLIFAFNYQSGAQVATSIISALGTFTATANTFTATQKFPTIQFSAGSMNQAFYIQTASISFGAVTAGAIVNNTYSYATLGMSNFPSTLINATISNSSTSANGARVIFSISAQSTSSFTVTGMNPTTTNAAASAFTLVCYGR